MQKFENTIENSEKINEFLKGFNYHTYHNYKSGLKNFLIWFNEQYPNEKFDEYIKDIRLMKPKEKIQVTDRYEKDIRYWLIELQKKYAPKTISTQIAGLRGLLIFYRIDIDQIFWKQLNYTKAAKSPKYDVIVSTPKELKEIMQQCPDIRAKSFFLILATSGLRINELCKLRIDDINLKYQCPRIIIRDPKNKVKGETRMSPEAKSAYLEYLKVREDKIRTSHYRTVNLGYANKDDDLDEIIKNEKRAYPFSTRSMGDIWNRMLEKSGYNEIDDSGLQERYKRNVHSLRSYFRTNYGLYNDNLAEYFINHISELKKTYDHKPKEWLDQEYLNGCKYLTVFEIPQDTSEKIQGLNEKLDEKDQQISNLERMMDEMKAQILELRLEKLEKANGIKNIGNERKK